MSGTDVTFPTRAGWVVVPRVVTRRASTVRLDEKTICGHTKHAPSRKTPGEDTCKEPVASSQRYQIAIGVSGQGIGKTPTHTRLEAGKRSKTGR